MKLQHWHALLSVHQQVRELLQRTLPAAANGAVRSNVRIGEEAMRQLLHQLLERVDSLRGALVGELGALQVEEAIRPYVFLLDELVLARLCDAEQPLWPLLQQRLFGQDSGGDLFFDAVDKKLEQAETPALYLELFYFCLQAGFEGRHADNAARLHEYKEKLLARIPRPMPPTSAPPPPPVEMMPIYEFPTRYYLATAVVIFSLPVLLWWLSNN